MPRPPVDLRCLLDPNKVLPVHLSRQDRDPADLPPWSVELHLTSACNYRCGHCSYGGRNRVGRRSVPASRVAALLDDLTGPCRPRGLYFSGGGEPTALKDWDRHVERVIAAGIDTALVTNGSLLREAHLGVVGRLRYIAVSIYSPRPEAYAAITGGSAFKAQFGLPGRIRAVSEAVVIGARNVINSRNHDHIPELYAAAIAAGYDYLICITQIDYEKRGLALSEAEIETLMRRCAAADLDPARTNLQRLLVSRFGYYQKPGAGACGSDCTAVRLRTNAFVNYDGGVWLCQPDIGNAELCIGNVNEQGFAAIWNGPRHREVVEKLCARWRAGACENCRAMALNRAVEAYEAAPANQPLTLVKDSFL